MVSYTNGYNRPKPTHNLRQIDLPDEVRGKFPESLGTLKHIKVLTCKEFITGKTKQNSKPKKWQYKRGTCTFHVLRLMRKENIMISTHECLKLLSTANWRSCHDCSDFKERTRWKIHMNITPIDTGNIPIPSIHLKGKCSYIPIHGDEYE